MKIRNKRLGWVVSLILIKIPQTIFAADVTFTIDPTADQHPISRYIYGINPGGGGVSRPPYAGLNLTLARMGGNRWTAYNWINNASNAGNDWHYSNDAFLDSSTEPGHAVRAVLSDGADHAVASIVTVPMNGFLSADKSGFVPKEVLPQNSARFVPEFSSAAADPKPSPQHVYQDQFIGWIRKNYAGSLPSKPHTRFSSCLIMSPTFGPVHMPKCIRRNQPMQK